MDKQTEAESKQGLADCEMKNANAVCTTVVHEKQIIEPEEGDWPEVAVNVSDTLLVKIKSNCGSSEMKHRRDKNVEAAAVVIDCSIENVSTEHIKNECPKSEYPCKEEKFQPEVGQMQNPEGVESKLMIKTQIKEEPLDWPEDGVDVSNSLFVEIEVYDDNLEKKHCTESNKETPATLSRGYNKWESEKAEKAKASSPSYILNTDNSRPTTNSCTVLYKYSCEHCNYKCMYASNLKFHMMTHTGEKPFACDHCDYKCSQASFLKRHMRTHTGEKPFSCQHCDYKCSQARDLKIHTMNHSGVKQFNCAYCDYKCSQASHLKRHVRTHTGVKPYSCGHCDYKCTQADNLKRHLRTHTGEKPFKCEQCNYKCRQASHLKRHLKMHIEGKALSCDHCDYKCRRVDSLDRHLSTHTSDKT